VRPSNLTKSLTHDRTVWKTTARDDARIAIGEFKTYYFVSLVFNRLLHDNFHWCTFYLLLFLNFIRFGSVFWRCIMHIQTVNCIQHNRAVCAVGLCGLNNTLGVRNYHVPVFQTVGSLCGRLLVSPRRSDIWSTGLLTILANIIADIDTDTAAIMYRRYLIHRY